MSLKAFICFLSLILLVQTRPISVYGDNSEEISKETAIDSLIVTRFEIATQKKRATQILTKSNPAFHDFLTKTLDRKSYLSTSKSDLDLGLNPSNKKIKKLAKKLEGDGLLVGQFDDENLIVLIKSGVTARTLAKWTFKLEKKLNGEALQKLAQEVVTTIVTTFPYRGFILGRKTGLVRINLGKKQAVKVGTRMTVFEFEGGSPTFASPKKPIGLIEVTQVGENAAAGKVIGNDQLPLFAKLAFETTTAAIKYENLRRYHDSFFVTAGFNLIFIDTYPSRRTDDIDQRLYQLTLSPFVNVGLGYGPFSIQAQQGQAENESNTVSFMMAEASYEVFGFSFGDIGVIVSPGVYYTNYETENTEDAELPLASQTTTAALIEGRLNWDLSLRSRLFFDGGIIIPVSAKDDVNGNATGSGSRIHFGIRILLGQNVAIEQSLFSQFLRYTFSSGDTVDEAHSSFNTKLFVLF
jgi:hypothetical protein